MLKGSEHVSVLVNLENVMCVPALVNFYLYQLEEEETSLSVFCSHTEEKNHLAMRSE